MLNIKVDDFETSGNVAHRFAAIKHVDKSEMLYCFTQFLPTKKHRKVKFSWEDNQNTVRVVSVYSLAVARKFVE
jgi:hypothetical protein